MAYSKVQFIGYVIDTAPQLNPDGSQTYLGLNNPQQDVQARCELMLRAMETAAASLPQASPPEPPGTTLKVFMAPEFYFRGAAGAYQMDDVQLAVAALQQLAAGVQWDDWVFAFGTIVGTSAPTFDVPPYDIDPSAVKEIYNFCLVQEGGVASQGDTGARVVMKELKSNIDFIASAANPGGLLTAEVNPPATSKVPGPSRENQQVNYDGAGIFQLRGITWALDICLDHGAQRLLYSPQLPGDSLVQLQLVPSCGMGIQANSVVCEFGGLVFNCDGLRNTRHSTLALLQPPLASVAMASSVAVPGGPLPVDSVSPPLQVPVSSLYAQGPGAVNYYPAQAIPPAETVQGSAVNLVWPATNQWTFKFLLVYAPSGAFTSLMCEIVSKTVDFHGNNYYTPLGLYTLDVNKQPVLIQMSMGPGSGGYTAALWCKIDVPGFSFQGNAFEFSGQASGPAPFTIW